MTRDTAQPSQDRLLTYDEVAGQLRVGRRMIERLIARGELTKVKVGSRTRIPAESLDAFVARGGAAA